MGKAVFNIAILLVLGITVVNGGDPKSAATPTLLPIKGRLLTPEEGCGFSKVPHKRIVGGSPAKNGAWPWMALLGYKKDLYTVYNCGGSLITSKHVLSAAHCINENLVVVRLGEYDFSTTEDGKHETIRVDHAVAHKQFRIGIGIHDIAIVFLVEDVEFTDRIRPICLPASGMFKNHEFAGKNPFLAGWGKNSEGIFGTRSPILHQVQLPVISNYICKEKYKLINEFKGEFQFGNSVLCAGFAAGGKDSCHGDSGGPLMLPILVNGAFPFFQIGVVSYGIGCGRENIPSIYANVSHYMNWINQNLIQ